MNREELRDYFAGQALNGELASQHPDFKEANGEDANYHDDPEVMDSLAEWCYRMADSMLKAKGIK